MKIYLAAPFAARELTLGLASQLTSEGNECTSSWLLSTRPITDKALGPSLDTSDDDVVAHALGDLDDVRRADVLIHLSASWVLEQGVEDRRLHTGGRHVEIGFALALGRPVVSLGEPENIFQRALCYLAFDFSQALLVASTLVRDRLMGQLESRAIREALLE